MRLKLTIAPQQMRTFKRPCLIHMKTEFHQHLRDGNVNFYGDTEKQATLLTQ